MSGVIRQSIIGKIREGVIFNVGKKFARIEVGRFQGAIGKKIVYFSFVNIFLFHKLSVALHFWAGFAGEI